MHDGLSPEQVAGRLTLEEKVVLHHETVYQYIYTDKAHGGELYKTLTRACKKYKSAMEATTNVDRYLIESALMNALELVIGRVTQ